MGPRSESTHSGLNRPAKICLPPVRPLHHPKIFQPQDFWGCFTTKIIRRYCYWTVSSVYKGLYFQFDPKAGAWGVTHVRGPTEFRSNNICGIIWIFQLSRLPTADAVILASPFDGEFL